MSDEQLAQVKEYTKILNQTITDDDNDLLDFVVDEVVDRVKIYLNATDLDAALNRVIARIVANIFNQSKNSQSTSEPESAISSVSDNGQSVSYKNEVKNYLTTATDNELFTGFESLLKRYRRINVVARKRD
ncbi:MAG: hypothetical protein Q4C83_00990 [Candidatus Saccharibacteria bacterium]|nr:hypothetical protein [Candidatus Saccharibacteria bacterium]